jgi:hypothetical protein
MFSWFKKSILAPGVTMDKFRIKIIILNDGTKKHYAQYKESNLSSDWLNILLLATGSVILHEITEHEEINGNLGCISKEEADILIEKQKQQLETLRAKGLKEEIYIKDL